MDRPKTPVVLESVTIERVAVITSASRQPTEPALSEWVSSCIAQLLWTHEISRGGSGFCCSAPRRHLSGICRKSRHHAGSHRLYRRLRRVFSPLQRNPTWKPQLASCTIKRSAQIFLVTINTLEGEPVETFANELFAKWKIGEKKTDRGALLLFVVSDRKRWIEIGYGLEGILNDAKVGDIGRDMVPALQHKELRRSHPNRPQKICGVIATDSGVTLDSLADSVSKRAEPLQSPAGPHLPSLPAHRHMGRPIPSALSESSFRFVI